MDSAVVADVETEVQLEHAITHERIRRWVPHKKLVNSLRLESQDRVIYNNWIGTIDAVSNAHMGLGSTRPIGLSGGLDRVQRWLFISYSGGGWNSGAGTIDLGVSCLHPFDHFLILALARTSGRHIWHQLPRKLNSHPTKTPPRTASSMFAPSSSPSPGML